VDWELGSSDGTTKCVSPFTAYLYGVVIILAVIIALGEWIGRRAHVHRTRDERDADYRSYLATAILWPLFITAVIFIVLWTTLTRRSR